MDTEEKITEWNILKDKGEKISGVIISFSVVCFMFVAGKVYMKLQDSRYSSGRIDMAMSYLDTSSPKN